MREFHGGSYDVAVIGAGHAGIEAALAAARMGMETICLTVSLDAVTIKLLNGLREIRITDHILAGSRIWRSYS